MPYTPSTVLKDVRDQVCRSLGLNAAGFGLRHSKRQLDLTVPFRYSNLVDNAHVDLVKLAAATGSIRVKVRVPGKSDFVGTFDASDNLETVAKAAGVDELALAGQTISGTLGSVANGSVLFTGRAFSTVKAPARPQQPPKPAQALPEATSGGQPVPEIKPAVESVKTPPEAPKVNGVRQFQVILPTTQAAIPDDEPELTQSQFRTYHKYLRDQAGPRPMLSKSTKEKLAQERLQSTPITVRVRLPDQTNLQAVFTSEELTDVVYDFVRSHLRDPLQEFYLTAVESTGKIELGKSLVHDYKLGSRVLLIFKWVHPPASKSPVLSDAVLKVHAQPAVPNEESKVSKETKEPEVTKAQKHESKHKGVPKWLKLHK